MGFSLKLSPWFRALRPPPSLGWRGRPRFAAAQAGNAAVEFAIVGPVLIMILAGIFTYGGYFLTAHTVQQMANDAARAAIAGLDDNERLQIARDTVQQSVASQKFMRGEVQNVTLSDSNTIMTVGVTYDASEDVYWSFAALLPVPAPVISRTATIRLGGY